VTLKKSVIENVLCNCNIQ